MLQQAQRPGRVDYRHALEPHLAPKFALADKAGRKD